MNVFHDNTYSEFNPATGKRTNMTEKSRVLSALRLGVAIIIGFSSFSFQVAAQQNAPLRLAPPAAPDTDKPVRPQPLTPSVIQPPKQLPAQPPQTAKPLPETMPKAGSIEVNSLQEINPDSGGTLSDADGGFGADMWQGVKRTSAEKLITLLPVNAASPTVRDIMRRLLLTTAIAPAGNGKPGNLIRLRIKTLAAMGERQSVMDLLELTRGKIQDDSLIQLEANALLLATDNARACALASEQIQKTDADFWQKLFTFCQILSGDIDKAQLSASLMQEANIVDDLFYQLIDSFSSGEAPVIETMPNPTPLQLAMARAAKARLPVDTANTDNPGILRAIAMSPNASKGLRLEAAERAEATGTLSVEALRQLYNSVEFSDQDLANPLSRADVEFGPTIRALLFHSALIQTIPTAQAEAVARAFQLAREEGRYPSTVRVFLPLLKQLPPSRDLIWFAPEVVRALLFTGDFETASIWYRVLKSAATFDNQAKKDLDLLLPVADLIGFKDDTMADKNILAGWKQAMQPAKNKDRAGAEKFQDQAIQFYALFDALGEPLPSEAWLDLVTGTGLHDSRIPNPAILYALNEITTKLTATPAQTATLEQTVIAAPAPSVPSLVTAVLPPPVKAETGTDGTASPPPVAKGAGEAIMLALLAIGEQGPAKADPYILGQIIKNMSRIGLKTEARKLAIEATLAWGL